MSIITRAFSAVVDDVDNSDRSIVAKISVENRDRFNSIIVSRGVNLKAYQKNPVVLFEHGKDPGRGRLPIGKNVWIRLDRSAGRLIAKTRFATDDFSSMLYEFYRDGTMRGWSISVLPLDAGPPSQAEIRSNSDYGDCETIYRAGELTEYSAVAVPGNANALTDPELRSISRLVVRGFHVPDDEVKSLIERMSESAGLAEGGALVKPEVARAEDEDKDEQDDESEDGDVERSEPTDDSDEVVERSSDEDEGGADDSGDDSEPADDSPEEDDSGDGDSDSDEEDEDEEDKDKPGSEVKRSIEDDPDPADDEPEAPVEPVEPELPPLVGRSFQSIALKHVSEINSWRDDSVKLIRDYAGWLRGEA